jgi:hypothetical protein
MPVHSPILLGEVAGHLATVHISCNFCPRRGKAGVGHLMREHGPHVPADHCFAAPTASAPDWPTEVDGVAAGYGTANCTSGAADRRASQRAATRYSRNRCTPARAN